jgi:hypothetical protein
MRIGLVVDHRFAKVGVAYAKRENVPVLKAQPDTFLEPGERPYRAPVDLQDLLALTHSRPRRSTVPFDRGDEDS